MQNRSSLLLILSIVGGFAVIASLVAFSGDAKSPAKLLPITGKSNQELIESCFTVQVMDRSYQVDGKVEVVYTNICPGYAFRLTKTGLKYKDGSKIKYLTRTTPVLVGSLGTETLELSIPFGIRPKVAYALADDAKALLVE